jgi:hypothetical protein
MLRKSSLVNEAQGYIIVTVVIVDNIPIAWYWLRKTIFVLKRLYFVGLSTVLQRGTRSTD